MQDIEIPLGRRKPFYRFLEILPGAMSYTMVILLIALSIFSPVLAAIYIFLVVITMVVKAVGIAFRTIQGDNLVKQAMKVDWHERLTNLESPHKSYEELADKERKSFEWEKHLENLRYISASEKGYFPKPSEIYNAVIIAIYNESLDVLVPTVESVLATSYDVKHLFVVLAYEERGGVETKKTVETLLEKYKGVFGELIAVEHPANLPNEVVGKGPNITHAGKALAKVVKKRKLRYSDVIVTALDSDNRPHAGYFDYVTYEYITHENRKRMSFQPVSLFMNNIWDVPAPMRIIAVGNSFWNIICSMRPHALRNFASHSQPLGTLVEMGFWSVRTIVEDGHQYWRSLFYFRGDYEVLPIRVPIYQDAVLSGTLWKTLRAQFVQLRRWDYGASDVAYVGVRLFSRDRVMKVSELLPKFVRLLDGHVTLAAVTPIVTFGGWIPLLIHMDSRDLVVHNLPTAMGTIQTVAILGLFVTILLSLRMLPKRPERYKKRKNIFMVIQWILMPVVSIVYSSFAAFYSQTRLMLGLRMEKFDVTDKVVKK